MVDNVKNVLNATLAAIDEATTKKEKDKWLNWLKGNLDMAKALGLITKEEAEKYRDYGYDYYIS